MDDARLYAKGFRFVVTKDGRDIAHTTTQREAEQEARRTGGQAHLMVPSRGTALAVRRNPPEGFGRIIESTPESFRNVVREYGQAEEWREHWWREAIQNSTDALKDAGRLTAGVIKCEAHEEPDGRSWRVSVEDNGTGMSKQVLLKNFLTIGGTGKKDESQSVGGFGEAKKLLLLPWESWSVRSHDYHAHGKGMHFRIDEGLPRFEGLKLEVVMPKIRHENRKLWTTDQQATDYIKKCDLRTSFFVNGARVLPQLKAGRNVVDENDYEVPVQDRDGNVVRTVKVGYKIHYVEDKNKLAKENYWPWHGRAAVRSGGVFMFTVPATGRVPGQLIVELTGAAKYILNPTRTQIANHRLESDIASYFESLAADIMSALEGKKRKVKPEKWTGIGKFSAKVAQEKAVEQANVIWNYDAPPERAEEEPDEPQKLDEEQTEKLDDVMKQVQREAERTDEGHSPETRRLPPATPELARDMTRNVEFKSKEHFRAAVKQLAWRPDFMILNRLTGNAAYAEDEQSQGESEKWKVPDRFKPEKMSRPVRRLARVWAELCRYVLVQLGSEESYGAGFVFSHKVSGLTYFDSDDNSKWLLVNPFKDRSAADEDSGFVGFKQMWDLKHIPDVKYLYSVAVHECTHLHNNIHEHREDFSSAMTRNVAQCADGWKYVMRIVNKISGDDQFSVETGQQAVWDEKEESEEDLEAHLDKLKAAVKRKKAELAKLESGDPAKLYKDRDIPKELGRLKPWPKVKTVYDRAHAATKQAAKELVEQVEALLPQVPPDKLDAVNSGLALLRRTVTEGWADEDDFRRRITILRAARDAAFPPPYALNELGVHRPWPAVPQSGPVSDATRKAAKRLVDEALAWHPDRDLDDRLSGRIRHRVEDLSEMLDGVAKGAGGYVNEADFRSQIEHVREARDSALPVRPEQVQQVQKVKELETRLSQETHAKAELAERVWQEESRARLFEERAQDQAARLAELQARVEELLAEGQRIRDEARQQIQVQVQAPARPKTGGRLVWLDPVRRGTTYVWRGVRNGDDVCQVEWSREAGALLKLPGGEAQTFESSGAAKAYAQENM